MFGAHRVCYNRVVHSTTNKCPFEVAYGFKPLALIRLVAITFSGTN
jgi:hypothetical protein